MRIRGLDAARGRALLSAAVTLSGSSAPSPPGPDARSLTAANTGLTVSESSLTATGSMTATTPGQVVENRKFTAALTVSAANIIVRNCLFVMSPQPTQYYGIRVTGSGALIEDCEIRATSGSVSYFTGISISGANATVRRVNASGGENMLTVNGGGDGFIIEDSYMWGSRTVSDPSGHPDVIEIYGGSGTIRRNRLDHVGEPDAPINISPFGSAHVDYVNIEDNWLDGGQVHVLVDNQAAYVRNVSIKRNWMGGHTAPFGDYALLQNNDGRPIVRTDAALTSNPEAILIPNTGAGVNLWYACTGLTPDKSGTVATE